MLPAWGHVRSPHRIAGSLGKSADQENGAVNTYIRESVVFAKIFADAAVDFAARWGHRAVPFNSVQAGPANRALAREGLAGERCSQREQRYLSLMSQFQSDF